MGITRGEVLKIAALARLRLSEDEVALYQAQLGRILELMAEISALDEAPPSVPGASAQGNVMRDDIPRLFPDVASLLSMAPETEGGYYKVKKVIA